MTHYCNKVVVYILNYARGTLLGKAELAVLPPSQMVTQSPIVFRPEPNVNVLLLLDSLVLENDIVYLNLLDDYKSQIAVIAIDITTSAPTTETTPKRGDDDAAAEDRLLWYSWSFYGGLLPSLLTSHGKVFSLVELPRED